MPTILTHQLQIHSPVPANLTNVARELIVLRVSYLGDDVVGAGHDGDDDVMVVDGGGIAGALECRYFPIRVIHSTQVSLNG